MKIRKNNNFFLITLTIFFISLGAIVNLIVHELSHLVVLLFCNGEVNSLSIGISSFVSGYVEQKHIAIIAMSSVIIPAVITLIISYFRQYYLCCFSCGFIIPTIINSTLGLFAVFFVKDGTRFTYDIALAFDNVNAQWMIVILTILILLICVYVMTKQIAHIYKAL